jgi:hypothetical protein
VIITETSIIEISSERKAPRKRHPFTHCLDSSNYKSHIESIITNNHFVSLGNLLIVARARAPGPKMTTFRSTPLFGGALIVDLPSTFTDIR